MREKKAEQNSDEKLEKQSLIEWIKEHKTQLILAGVSITAIVATIVGLKNKTAITQLWDKLKNEVEKGKLYTAKWFDKSSTEELEAVREMLQKDYLNPKLDAEYRNECFNLIRLFDKRIGEKNRGNKEYVFPVHREHGWYLLNKD